MGKDTKRFMFCLIALVGFGLSLQLNPIAGLTQQGVRMLAIALAAAFLWITEAVPIGVTGVLIIFFEVWAGVFSLAQGLSFLAHPVNTVVVAGYLLAAILVKSGLDVRIGLTVIARMGEKTDRLILGMMISTAFLSLWMSNTAATAIMIPIALGILNLAGVQPGYSNMGKAMTISIAYAANIGGMGTPTGTPANPIAIAFLESMADIRLSFLDWMIRAMPLVILLIPLSWLLLKTIYPLEIQEVKGGLSFVKQRLTEMGKLNKLEKKVLRFFVLAILVWSADSFIPLHKDWLYLVSAVLSILIVTPKIGFLSWKEAEKKISWGILLVIGGGLAMGTGLQEAGVIDWITALLSSALGQTSETIALLLIALITGGIGITLFCTISGTATVFLPVAIALALKYGWNPVAFGVVACLSCSFAYLLPANTAPNAIAYDAGYFKISDMFTAGIMQVILSILVLMIIAQFY